jgi:hypothetical protein
MQQLLPEKSHKDPEPYFLTRFISFSLMPPEIRQSEKSYLFLLRLRFPNLSQEKFSRKPDTIRRP